MTNVVLRPHHLLCTVLFSGHGYSEAFTREMAAIVKTLEGGDALITLTSSPDAICAGCPNRTEEGRCLLDDDSKPGVGSLDARVIRQFGLPAGSPLPSREVYQRAKERVTREFFEDCCASCRWYGAGLCGYDEYIKRIKRFT